MDLASRVEEAQEEAQREQRRQSLLAGMEGREAAMREVRSLTVQLGALDKEREAAMRAFDDRVSELKKARSAAHRGVEFARECEAALIAEFVPLELVKSRDKAHSAFVRASQDRDIALADVNNHKALMDSRSAKTVKGPRQAKDGSGYVRHEPKPGQTVGEIVLFDNPNPRRYREKEEAEQAAAYHDTLLHKLDEATARVERAQKALDSAEAALSEAKDNVFRG